MNFIFPHYKTAHIISKNLNLTLSDLESEITEKERESRREKIEKGFTKVEIINQPNLFFLHNKYFY